jgi:two-component system, LytTR family, sensor kinase
MRKSIVISLHLIYWVPKSLILISLFVTSFNNSSFNPTLSFQAINPVATFICFYIFYLYLFPVFLAKRRIPHFIIFGSLTWLILSLLSFVVLQNLELNFNGNKPPLVFLISNISLAILFAGLIGSFFKGFLMWYSDIRIKEQLIQKNVQSELALLKAQINPHFLFNTINNIDILIEKDPHTASRYLQQLSEIMRFMLYETSEDFIALSTELEYISKYIELQKIRTVNDKYVNFSVSGATGNLKIAPAIFIPFIENAFKHSTNKKIEDAIKIIIIITGTEISFSCCNFFDNSNTFTQEKSGLGTELIKQRLQLIYGERHNLAISKSDNQFKVNLHIKTK